MSLPIVVHGVIRQLASRKNTVLADTNQGLYLVSSVHDARGPNALANELIGTELMKALALPHAEWGIATMSRFAASSNLLPHSGSGDGDIFFASKFPNPPRGGFLCHYLPKSYKTRIRNRIDFVGAMVFDLWAASISHRQIIYLNDPVSKTSIAIFTNNESLFGGPGWDLRMSVGAPRYFQRWMYEGVIEPALIDSWVKRLQNVIPVFLPWIVCQVPGAWYHGDILELCDTLLSRLPSLRDRVYDEYRNRWLS